MSFKYDLSSVKIKYTGSPVEDLDTFVDKFKTNYVLRDYTDAKKVLAFQHSSMVMQ